MVDLLQIASAVSVVTIFVLAAVIRSIKGGYLGNVIRRRRQQKTVLNGTLGDIKKVSEETYEETKQNGEQLNDLGEAIYLLHRNDENVDEDGLRDKVGVDETPGDIFSGSGDN